MSDLLKAIATRQSAGLSYGFQDWLPNPDPVLKKMGKDISVYRDLLSDAHVGGCTRRRKAAVRGLESRIDRRNAPARVHKVIETLFADLPLDTILQEMLDATLYGYQPMEVIWQPVGGLILPSQIVGKPPEWFCFDAENRLLLKTHQSPRGEVQQDKKFLLPRQEASYQNPYGIGDLSRVFWPATFKKGGLKFWLTFSEKFGIPFMVGKVPRGTSQADSNTLLEQLAAMVQDAVGVIPDDSSVEPMEANKTSSTDLFERLLMYCKGEISIALLGQNQTTEKESNRASATAGANVTHEIRDGDARMLESAINQLIQWVCELNFAEGPRPVFELFEQEEIDTKKAERDEKLTRAGAKFTNAYFEREYDLQPGDLAEQVTEPREGKPITMEATDFAEADPAQFPDQAAIDAVVNDLAPAQLQAQAVAMLQPVIDAITAAKPDVEVLGLLAELYPAMDSSGLEEMLTRLLFAAEVWGRLSVEAEQ